MIKTFIDKLLGKRNGDAAHGSGAGDTRKRFPVKTFGKRVEVPASVHRIDPSLVDRRAIEVVKTLQDKGFEAYIVGGAVRDLLLGLRPKDFDVATNATPEQVKAAFRRAFIIGRRFRIVHVVFGRGREHEVIEVTTFRAYLDNQAADRIKGNEKTSRQALAGMQHAVDASGRVLRDNVWGTQQEDAARRDFSINAMYYDPQSQIVVDYHHGIEDARKRTIRMIGDATARYREDPVRMVRAIRFAAKLHALGFTLGKKTAEPLAELRPLLADIPPSRMFDEMLKLLQTGHAIASVQQLRALGLSEGIYPLLDLIVARADTPLVRLALEDTDRRVAEGKSVAPAFLLACVLWEDVLAVWQRRQAAGEHPSPALSEAITEVFERRVGDVSGRGKLGADMREIWMLQPRFTRRSGKTPASMVTQPRFRAGLDFLRLRSRAGEPLAELADWWERFSLADEATRAELLESARRTAQQTGKADPERKPRRRRKPASATPQAGDMTDEQADPTPARAPHAQDAADGTAALDDASAPAPAKKRRRRRRKSAGGSEEGLANDSAAETGDAPAP
ncbi:poly(A) polymerase [Lampropedia cohaerens]|uniref:Poly(A) polymerase I n=1 Tax=Lampropedia cohaerens TaxID=1610491 RepID=A0A0U1Q154_9BURK|nr:polynucleotide adenylyltransferase PcnB [Lampropedia cohaerens]KKW68487.1 poly(A) polymerase [Lampropedia cohaerens]